MLRSVPAFLGLCLLLLPGAATAQSQRQWFEGGATPLRYEISITPNVDAATFSGEAVIEIESEAAVSSVSMNALDLTIARAAIDNRAASFTTDAEAQTLTLTPRRALAAGRHTLRIAYTGKIQDEAYGVFRVSYDAGGVQKRALATQFEPGDARRFAPMWDQPDRRAVFSLSVTAPAHQMVVSNMPVARTAALRGGLTRTTFADTPSMASYLLFVLVGDFERVTRDVNGVELGVVVRRGETRRAGAALDAGEQSLNYFTDYFGVPYPLPKLDMVGVPGAGGFGAMENWGAILYFDQYLLVDENSNETERQNVFGIVAHEIAHQWFGDLVTMAWWDDLWLNEGFASWMAAKATEAIHPDWGPWLAQLSDGTASAMALDARAGTHPIVQTVNTIDEANLAFDAITYEKGLAVIRMIEGYVGEENFRAGVRDYISAHRYGNARTEELWRAIQAASGEPVLDIARSFTTQPGFPVLRVSRAPCARGAGQPSIQVSQRRFAMDEASRTDEVWSVPVVARLVGGEPVETVLPAEREGAIEIGNGCGPYLVNAGQSALFRVLYDHANLEALARAMPSLDPADQLGLLLDYWAFGRSGDAPFTDYLDLAAAVPADANPHVASDTVASMQALANYAQERPSRDMVEAYARERLAPFMARVGWEAKQDESPADTLLRAQLIATLGALRDEAVVAEAQRRVADADANPLPADIRGAVLGVFAQNATPEQYEDMLARARAAADFVEQRRLWLYLSAARDPALAQRTLDLTLGDDIPRQIRTQVISAVAGNHPRLAWDFLVAHRQAIEALLDPLQRLDYPPGIATQSSDPAIADALQAYAHDFPAGAQPSIAGAVSTIRSRAETIEQRMPAVEAWIEQHQQQRAQPRATRRRARSS